MPPATAATTMVSLRELADLAIGTPEVGAVNFTALHTLIVAMLRSLSLQEVRIDFQSPLPSPEPSRPLEPPQAVLSAPQLAVSKEKPRGSLAKPPTAAAALESQVKGLGGQVQDLSRQLKTVTNQVQGIVSHVQHLTAPISELGARDWLEEETAKLTPARARAGSLEIAKGERATVSQAMELLHDVVEDVKTLKEAQEKAQELPESSLAKALQRIDVLEKIVRERDEILDLVNRKMSLMPVGEEVTMVTWEELEQAITDGWKASQGSSETTTGLPKRKGRASVTSNDILQGGVPIKGSSADPALDSPSGYGSDQTLSGISGIGKPSEGVTRERSRGASATAVPGREQHPRARDEGGQAKSQHPSMSQFRVESDHHRTRELPPHGLAHLRKDEREAHPGPVQQDLPEATVARDQHHQVSPDQHRGVYPSQGQIYPRPVQHGLRPLGTDPLAWRHPSTYPHGVVPLRMDQLGMMPPGMDEQRLVPPGMDQYGMVPPLVPGTEQQGLELPSTAQPGMVPRSTYQYGVVLPGTDQQPGVDQHGLVPFTIDQHGFLISGMDQQGLVLPGMDQHGLVPHLTDRNGLVSPGLMQVAADQQGFIQPSLETSGFIQPSTEEHDIIQPGADQRGLVPTGTDQATLAQPGAGQRGLVQPGARQRGLVQPGVGQHGLVQPGAGQRPEMDRHGLVQPGMDQRGLVQPGLDQHGLVQPGMGQHGLVQPGAGQRGLVQLGAGQPGLAQPGMDQVGLVQPGAGQPGLVRPRMDQRGLVQPGAGQPGLAQPGMDQRGLVQPGVGQSGLAQPGMDQRGLVLLGAGQPGLVQPGMDQRGLVQPGAGQPDLVQPGMDPRGLVQPGAGQPGLAQPGMDQRGLVQPGVVQPGMDPRGLVQPGAGQPGLAQPGMDQRGLVQPGAAQPGLVQPGAAQPGLVHPGAGQRGLAQPRMDQHGLVQPGVGQRGLAQPRMDQRGLVQPGAGQPSLFQPGMGQPAFVQPGADQRGLGQVDQRGLVQAGADPHGFFQPGAYPPGLVQPGAYPRGLVQPGTYPQGFLQPSTDQRGLVQPGIDQHGLRQAGTEQRGLIPPGTELRGLPTFHPEFPRFFSHPYQHGVIPPGRYQYDQVSPLLASQGLASPGIGQEGLSETYQQGLLHRGTDQHGLTPLSSHVGSVQRDPQHLVSPGPDQQGQVQAGTDQHDRAYSIPESRDLLYPSPHSPGVLGVDPYVQIGLDPKQIYASDQPGISVWTTPSQAAASARSKDSLNYLYRVSSEKSDFQSERHDSLDKLAPSFPMAVETFRLMGELIGLYVELKESMKELDEEQEGQTDLEKIQHLLGLMVKKSIPADLQEQLKTLKSLTKEVRQEKAKMDRVQRILEGNGEQEIGKDMKNGQLSLQLGILRVTVADIEKELAELRESQERGKVSMEHSVSEASLYLQDQLDKLRTIIESMLASSSTLLSMSMAPHKTLSTLEPGQIDPEATCPACSLDLSHQVSTLVQRYEQLQDMVNNLAASRPSKKAKLQSQDEELLGHVQSAILQVQGDCEKLNITTSNLIEDHRQKQKDIDALYQGLEKLEKEKANRGHLEMEIDVKADKSALAAKVSRVQFDATTEQLNHMMQELVAKMSGQEQDWQKMLDKLLVGMDSKLDRLELDPVKQLLEDRWKSLRQQLKEHSPLYQADEAAAMRRQLLAHFHCLSCDRPLETAVTGQFIPVTPVGPALPGHRSLRPYTIFELEQVRQQSRNLKLGGTALPRGELAHMERSVGRLRTMHSKMLMDIEKVQIHFGGSVKASSQMIRELLQAQCLSSPCYKRVLETADCTSSSGPRRCGGSHTLTYPYRRNRLQHLPQGPYPPDEARVAVKHDEVDILGLDGHIYKGRMDTRLPGVLTKDSESSVSGMTKHRAKQSRPHIHRQQSLSDNDQLPSRPQSAQMLAGNSPVPALSECLEDAETSDSPGHGTSPLHSARPPIGLHFVQAGEGLAGCTPPPPRKDRPLSSEGHLAQPNAAHPPSPSEMEMQMDMKLLSKGAGASGEAAEARPQTRGLAGHTGPRGCCLFRSGDAGPQGGLADWGIRERLRFVVSVHQPCHAAKPPGLAFVLPQPAGLH
ncbi:PREDICTED: glutamine-rich protein 2 [Odobenus rosmarus divergens]|uniref:Glutamine-rich protein 2 n=1 Tax=Odobenus rosmarus divergens TaxID=9708 RepID=A0A2U3VHZ6_ODORO|nr:PREDICTED: glutamine-rich protein 2 [Odobenus rosmarus divergens]